MIKLVFFSVFVVSISALNWGEEICQDGSGCRLARQATYLATAPKKVCPNEVYGVYVTILKNFYKQINVKASIRRQDDTDKNKAEEIASALYTFQTVGSTLLELLVPGNAQFGNYSMHLEGTETGIGAAGGHIFNNETELVFDIRQVVFLVQMSKPLYRQGQKVMFRVMSVEKNLLSRSSSMEVYVIDATGIIVKRWLAQQTNAGGVLDLTLQLSDQPAYGEWKIQVSAFGYSNEKKFRVDEFFATAIDVNVSMSMYHYIDEFAVAGVINANLSLGQPSSGIIEIQAEILNPPGLSKILCEPDPCIIKRPARYFPGVTAFKFAMSELQAAAPGQVLADKEVRVTASVKDWFLLQKATGSALTVIYDNIVKIKLLGDKYRTFVPHRKMTYRFAVIHPDGSPLNRQRRMMRVERSENNGNSKSQNSYKEYPLVGDDGIATYSFTPTGEYKYITVTAQYDMESSSATLTARATRVYSKNNVYIYVETTTAHPEVDKYMIFTVRSNVYAEKVFWVLASGGNIATHGVLEMQLYQQKTFSLALSRDMMPQAHMVVWIVHKGQVFADSLHFFTNGTYLNSVDVRFNRGKDFTREKVEVSGKTDPSSYIGVSVIDYELWSYGFNPFLTEPEVVRALEAFDTIANKSEIHSFFNDDSEETMIHFPAAGYAIDANKTFEYAGLVVLTDARVNRLDHYCNETIGSFPCMDGNCYTADEICDGSLFCFDGQDEMGCPEREDDIFTPRRDRLGILTRHYVQNGEWMWGGHYVMPNGRLDVIVDVPDEPMSWVLGGFGISHEKGFGIVHNPVRYQATRSFYMRIEAPTQVIKGEQIGIRIALFNYWDEHMECLLTLLDSPQYKFVVVEEFGRVFSYSPRTVHGNIQTMVYLAPRKVFEIHFPISPIVDGCIQVSISAMSFLYEDLDTVEICTQYDGVPLYFNTPFFIDLINSGSMELPDLEIIVPEQFILPHERKHLYVPGSPVAKVGIVGDVVGPGFFEDRLDCQNTLRLPPGGSEQTAYEFGYNLFNLLYLKYTDQLEVDVLVRTVNYLDELLQRLLGYMNKDGSFSMFRDYQEHTPSVWATSFALRMLNQANLQEWEAYFYVPSELMNRAVLWLCLQQQPDGTFYEIAPLYDRKLRSGNRENPNGRSNITMTAYVLASLAEINKGLSGEASTCSERAKERAQTYLELIVSENILTEPYQAAIITYALHTSGSDKKSQAFQILDDMKRITEFVYWADKPIPPNGIRMVDTKPYLQPRELYDNEGYAVEASAYALMIYLKQKSSDVPDIMKFLQSMRNSFAGQASTQDSIIAMQALVEFSRADTNRALYSVNWVAEATSMGNYSHTVTINRNNWVDLHTININPVWGSVRGYIQGTGLALLQLYTEVNVEYPEQIRPVPQSHYFDINMTRSYGDGGGRNFSTIFLNPCTRWVRPDISNHTGLTVMEVSVPTGYVITNDVLRSYVQSGVVPTLRRAEMLDRKIFFFFDQLAANEWTCVKFEINRWFPVANMTIQHGLKVYDYYEPGMFNKSLYNTFDLFQLHICQVCGSYQCPYCPFYNSAEFHESSLILVIVSLIFYLSKQN